jgi:hypothetical protein
MPLAIDQWENSKDPVISKSRELYPPIPDAYSVGTIDIFGTPEARMVGGRIGI